MKTNARTNSEGVLISDLKATARETNITTLELMKNKLTLKRALFGIMLLFIAVASFYAWHLYNKPVESMKELTTDYKLNATQLQAAYETDEKAADKQYLGKVLEVSGTIFSIDKDAQGNITLLLETENPVSAVSCSLEAGAESNNTIAKEGDVLKIKGLCSGYLSDVVMVRCIILN